MGKGGHRKEEEEEDGEKERGEKLGFTADFSVISDSWHLTEMKKSCWTSHTRLSRWEINDLFFN